MHIGILRWKFVSIYINKKSQAIVKLKSKHVGGAFSKKTNEITGLILKKCMLHFAIHRNVYPSWALAKYCSGDRGHYLQLIRSASETLQVKDGVLWIEAGLLIGPDRAGPKSGGQTRTRARSNLVLTGPWSGPVPGS